MGAQGGGKSKVKKKLAFLLCLAFFLGGWAFNNLYLSVKPSLQLKAVRRQELRKTLKLHKNKLSGVSIVDENDMGSYTRTLLRFQWQGFSFDAYLLVPKQNGEKSAAILALHGHKTTKEDIVGIKQSRANINFGLRLVKQGLCVLVPDIPFSDDLEAEDQLSVNLIMSGSHITGLRLSYLLALLDYLTSLPFVDSTKVGCAGWSMGGALTMYLAAVEKRIKVVAISDYFGTYRGTLMRVRSSTDNYVPGILIFGDMADVACLIAPRPLWLELGEKDPEFPQESFIQGIEALKKCYTRHEEHLTWQLIPGGHKFKGEGIEEFFKKWL